MATVLVCGGRDFADETRVFNGLEYFDQSCDGPITKLIHGGAQGADALAAEWASKSNVPAQCFAANWRKYGKRAGPLRNQRMLDEGKPDFVLAFPGGKGTADMIRRAEDRLIRIERL